MINFIKELKNNINLFYWLINKDETVDEIQLGDYLLSNCVIKTLKEKIEIYINISFKNGKFTKHRGTEKYDFLIDSDEGKEIIDLIYRVKIPKENLGDSEIRILLALLINILHKLSFHYSRSVLPSDHYFS